MEQKNLIIEQPATTDAPCSYCGGAVWWNRCRDCSHVAELEQPDAE